MNIMMLLNNSNRLSAIVNAIPTERRYFRCFRERTAVVLMTSWSWISSLRSKTRATPQRSWQYPMCNPVVGLISPCARAVWPCGLHVGGKQDPNHAGCGIAIRTSFPSFRQEVARRQEIALSLVSQFRIFDLFQAL